MYVLHYYCFKFVDRFKLTFSDRSKFVHNPISKKLFEIIYTTKTTLCVAAALTSATDLLNLAEQVGSHICLRKLT
jgi:uridine monophosphate synthetase